MASDVVDTNSVSFTGSQASRLIFPKVQALLGALFRAEKSNQKVLFFMPQKETVRPEDCKELKRII